MLLDVQPDALPRKRLEQIRGFLGYVTQTYRAMIPYLNGLHMAIDGWRDNRDDLGWKISDAKLKEMRSKRAKGGKSEVDSSEVPSPERGRPRT